MTLQRTMTSFTVHKNLVPNGQTLAVRVNGVVDEYLIERIEPITDSSCVRVYVRLLLPLDEKTDPVVSIGYSVVVDYKIKGR